MSASVLAVIQVVCLPLASAWKLGPLPLCPLLLLSRNQRHGRFDKMLPFRVRKTIREMGISFRWVTSMAASGGSGDLLPLAQSQSLTTGPCDRGTVH